MQISDFIPPIITKMVKKCRGKKKVEIFSTLDEYVHTDDTVFVVGNGPSLKTTMEKYAGKVSKNDVIAVNCMALTDYFAVLKPKAYLLVDPIYWDEQIVNPTREKLYDKLIADTKWPMTIAFPDMARRMRGIERLKANENLRLLYFNTRNTVADTKSFEAWDKNLVGPPAQTVMNTALYLAIKWRYQNIYIIGADSSFLADLHVDQKTNKLYSLDTHFYSNQSVYKNDVYKYEGEVRYFPQKFHEELLSESIAFSGYWDLRYYAEYAGVQVYNASEFSWIDAFERKKLG